MLTMRFVRARRLLLGACLAFVPATGLAQYAESPRTLGVVDGFSRSAVQIGRRLFVAGFFSRVSPPTGTAVVVDASGAHVPGAFPAFAGGPVHAIVPDGLGGWVVVGGFTSAAGQPHPFFARVRPDRAVDPRYRLTADGPIRRAAIAHGRIYLVGDFTTINGARRVRLAALEAATGQLTAFAADFNPGRTLSALSISSIGVYVIGSFGPDETGRVWGFDASSGRLLFERQAWVNAIAATSTRVYVGGFDYRRPVWAIDPLTGQDDAWSAGLAFRPVSGTYGDYTSVGALLLDEGRLYLTGRFSATRYSQANLAAVIAETGQPVSWHAEGVGVGSGLVRIGPALVVTGEGARAFAVTTGLALEWYPRAFGGINTVAPAPEGAVIGGSFNGIGGEERSRLAAFDLDSGAVEPWTAALPSSVQFDHLDTDGTWLFGITQRGAFYKIDPTTGGVVATLDFGNDVYLVRHRVAGGRIVVAVARLGLGGHELAVITTADWSRRLLAVTFAGPLSNDTLGIEVAGDTAYVAGTFTVVNGADRPYLTAVNLDTGAVLPFAPSPEAFVGSVTVWNGALVAAGPFRRIGGARRRGLAALDPVTGRALDWNPDAVGAPAPPLDATAVTEGTRVTFAWRPPSTGNPSGAYLIEAGTEEGRADLGQRLAAGESTTFEVPPGRYWARIRSLLDGQVSAPSVELFVDVDTTRALCSGPPAAPEMLSASIGLAVELRWQQPDRGPVANVQRIVAGSAPGLADLTTIEVPGAATSFTAPLPPRGTYYVRVQGLNTCGAGSFSNEVRVTVRERIW